MSFDMVRHFVAQKLATAVSAGILYGETLPGPDGHKHRFAVLYDDLNQMFVGETSLGGSGPHSHYIMVSTYDVVNTTLKMTPKDETEITAMVEPANMPENMRRIMAFYNLKEIKIQTRENEEHQHTLVLRYAGHDMDKMGRKVDSTASLTAGFEKTKEHDAKLAEVKTKAAEAEAHIEKVLKEAIKNAKK